MAGQKSVWGIDIGQCALKALKLCEVEGRLRVEAFDIIEHAKILSQPDADREELIREALQRFLANADVSGCHVVMSVSGQSGYSKFTKLPPVEARRVPDIVRFEAEQQIPFPINEVIWRWQTFHDPDSPDVEVGIFAMKRSDVAEMLQHLRQVGLKVDSVQMAPLSLYNFMRFDEQLADDGATLLADVGADKTDLVIADKGRVWTRTIQIGGNNFTEALMRTFKLSFEKAEKLKRAAATSKYARQIFQAMRPVFADLVQEIQRSIGYYTSLHRETRFKRVVGLGNGFRLPGLQKFIEQNLNIPVTRIDSYNKLAPSAAVNAPVFHENVLSLAVAYGLAIQGLGRGEVDTNLLPEEILRRRLWNRKRPWFVAAAVVLLAALFCPGYRARLDSATLEKQSDLQAARKVLNELESRVKTFTQVRGQGVAEEQQIERLARLFGYRDFWPGLHALISRSIEAVAPNQPAMADYARYLAMKEVHEADYKRILAGKGKDGKSIPEGKLDEAAAVLLSDEDQVNYHRRVRNATPRALTALAKTLIAGTGDALDANSVAGMKIGDLRSHVKRLLLRRKIKDTEAFKKLDRKKRRVIVVERLSAVYAPDFAAAKAGRTTGAGFGASAKRPASGRQGFRVELVARTTLPQAEANKMVADLRVYSTEYARWFSSLSVDSHTGEWLPAATTGGLRTGAGVHDPLMPDEDMSQDTRFKVVWWVEVVGDGIVTADVQTGKTYSLKQVADLLPELDPANAVASAKRIQELPVGTAVTVEAIETKRTVPWCRVKAVGPGGKSLGAGWVDGAAVKVGQAK